MIYATSTGPCAAIGRWLERISVAWTLKWAEEDRALTAAQLAHLPRKLAAQDRDIDHLRVRQMLLQRRR